MALYELFLLGTYNAKQREQVEVRIQAVAAEYHLRIPEDLTLADAPAIATRDAKATSVALYFGGDPQRDLAQIAVLESAKIPIIPVLADNADPAASLPEAILVTNAAFIGANDPDLTKLCAAALECLGLLPQQRRVFVSYRRKESRDVALQLHDELSGHGFDVFLDTHDIRPGEPFQEMLWHRLADCDVVIVLDTPDYFGSKWTNQEIGRSLAKGIHILRLAWPNHKPTRALSLSESIQLTDANMIDGKLTTALVDDVIARTERLRSRSVATRHMDLAGKLEIEVKRIGGTFEGIGAHRALALTLPNGLQIQAYPLVGIPTARSLNDIQDKADQARHGRIPCLVYDHKGIRPLWLAHLKWLDDKIRDVRALKVDNAAWDLIEWDNP